MIVEQIELTDEQRRRQRKRSIAIALGLVAMAALFYVVTLVKGVPLFM